MRAWRTDAWPGESSWLSSHQVERLVARMKLICRSERLAADRQVPPSCRVQRLHSRLYMSTCMLGGLHLCGRVWTSKQGMTAQMLLCW